MSAFPLQADFANDKIADISVHRADVRFWDESLDRGYCASHGGMIASGPSRHFADVGFQRTAAVSASTLRRTAGSTAKSGNSA
jgi:hypothetical protein